MKNKLLISSISYAMIFGWTNKSYAYDYVVFGAQAVASATAATLTAGAIYQYWATKQDDRNYPAPGKMVDVGGYSLHINCTGMSVKGQPTVVLEAGSGLSSIDWFLVQPEIAKFARVCSVDRAGYGWSDASPLPRTIENIAEELRLLLAKSGELGPFILVGHSFGGASVRVLAQKNPQQVWGLILVDAIHEESDLRLPKTPIESFSLQNFVMDRPKLANIAARVGLARLILRQQPHGLRSELQAMVLAKRSTTKFIRALSQEGAVFNLTLKQLKKVAEYQQPELGNIPLTVITAGRTHFYEGMSNNWKKWSEEMDISWRILQKELATKSTHSRHVFAEKSGHMIHRDQPEIIVDEIKEMIKLLDN